MRFLLVVMLVFSFSIASFSNIGSKGNVISDFSQKYDEKAEFDLAAGHATPALRISALKKFISKYPSSELVQTARELISGARAEIGDEKLRVGENREAIRYFKLAASETPDTISNRFFSRLLVKYPANLYIRNQREAAFEVAKIIEDKVSDNPNFLLGLATFYLTAERGYDALRIANQAIELDPNSSAALHTKGFALRMNFDLDGARNTFEKALALDPDSTKIKTSYAEMLRATGDPNQAATVYREVLAIEPKNEAANLGIILSLFETGHELDAESTFVRYIAENPKNFQLLAAAANWYAANDESQRAIDLANQAIQVEPRYAWSYLALSRGYLGKGNPIAAETALLNGSKYGNFPTLRYELALARYRAGFFREAAETLKSAFSFENGKIKTRLGGKVEKTATDFSLLLADERRASIFQFESPKDLNEEGLKNLLAFEKSLAEDNEEEIVFRANLFATGSDSMQTHRRLYTAERLLEKEVAPNQVLALAKKSIEGVDASLEVENPAAAVLAEELYEGRKVSLQKNQIVIIPDISKVTLSKIVRGRIEEISGRAHFANSEIEKAKTKLNLAISVFPPDSAWSRSTHWKLGTIYETEGNNEAALNEYILGYRRQNEESGKRIVIESIYKKVNGNLDGLNQRLEKNTDLARTVASTFLAKKEDKESSASEKKVENTEQPTKVNTIENAAATQAEIENKEETPSNPDMVDGTKKVTAPSIEVVKSDLSNVEQKTINTPNINKESARAAVSSTSSVPIETNTNQIQSRVEVKKEEPLVAQKMPSKEFVEPTKKTVISNIESKPGAVTSKSIPVESVQNSAPNTVKEDNAPERKPIFNPVVISIPKPTNPASTVTKIESDATRNSDISKSMIAAEGDNTLVIDANKPPNDSEIVKNLIPCEIILSQNEVTLMNNGNTFNVIAGIEGKNEADPKIIPHSISPKDVEVTELTNISALPGKTVFYLRSISNTIGLFTVTFEAPCGKKTIRVKVR